MNIGRIQKLVTVCVILPAALVYFGLRFYAQFRHVDVYVSRVAPMPAELASGLHMEEHKIDPMVTIETPYEKATDKILALEEIHRLRQAIAWGSSMTPFIDSLTILNPTNVVARKYSKGSVREFWLAKEGDRWTIEREKRSPVHRFLPE